ncbi:MULTISPECIES: magnesium transporter CorA family protein [unclassified Butyrivibrio]|uniref:magnesium transporter CorA family protein n=1 Tax=unclassified Butyrivibrio TaxID=2639466 RepID=UPI0003B42F1E|nr:MULTISPECIES: CorA family divalent cation transporter [unclassified Butyrivibrio]MDC7293314.1 magnesium transporter CorA [Butyrivibrio sp. DSM 10294]
MYYLIRNTLEECSAEQCHDAGSPYVAVLTPEQWQEQSENFDMGIDFDLSLDDVLTTKAEVNFDSLTGTFCIPAQSAIADEVQKFSFALDETGIVFIDAGKSALSLVKRIQRNKKWRKPSLERFLYDFLEMLIHDDLQIMQRYERELDSIEKEIMANAEEAPIQRNNEIRGDIRDLRIHYEQLQDFGQELEENENGFFDEDNLRYFHMFSSRVDRLYDAATHLRDYTIQLNDLYQSQLDVKQNRIMTVLTVVTTIFMPLTLIAGWYGMNFKYMPELESRVGYPVIIILSIAIVVGSLVFFKVKKII